MKPIVKVKKPYPTREAAQPVRKAVSRQPEAPIIRLSVAGRSAQAKEGRTLLRLLEHGAGPIIEIAWPESGDARSSLYRLLRDCYGMRTALMETGGALYVAARDRNWQPDMDRYSGFVRQPMGILPSDEKTEAGAIRRRHGLGSGATVVRLFPRHVDAVLLGGLRSILGERYQSAKTVHAAYRQDGSRLFIDNIAADGASVRGRIAFSATRKGCG